MPAFDRIEQLVYICFSESSIHGLPLVVRKQRLFIERIFWFLCVTLCITFTTSICYDQWARFDKSPVVSTLETNYRTWKFKSPLGVTICSNYTDRRMARKIVERTWNINRNHSRFEYYEQFILAISMAKYFNLEMFRKFANDSSLDHVDFLQVANEMRHELRIPPSPEYTNVITEMGVCHSTTKLAYIQKPFSGNMSDPTAPEPDNTIYSSVDVFRLIITPHFLDTENVTIYLHNKNEIISAADSIHESLIKSMDIMHTEVQLLQVVSTDALRGLRIKRRKCLYFDEGVLQYFPIYTTNLCKMNCRIRAALFSCGCVPFFYNLNTTEPTCNSTGLYCLSKSHWYSRKCKCYPLCDSIEFVRLYSEKVFYSTFSRLMEVSVIFPKARIKRRIIFSIYELIVSFGGGAAFFLGCSFLSSVEIGFFVCEWFWSLISKCKRRPVPIRCADGRKCKNTKKINGAPFAEIRLDFRRTFRGQIPNLIIVVERRSEYYPTQTEAQEQEERGLK